MTGSGPYELNYSEMANIRVNPAGIPSRSRATSNVCATLI